MRPLLSPPEANALDRRAMDQAGFPEYLLIENTGRSIWEWVIDSGLLCGSKRILVLAGKGNNGADALAAVRHGAGHPGADFRVVLSSGSYGRSVSFQLELLKSYGISAEVWHAGLEVKPAEVVLEGLTGTGFRPPVTPETAQLIRWAEASGGIRVSLDLPSGLTAGAPECFKAHHTLTLAYHKTPLYFPGLRENCGQISCLDIAFPPLLEEERHPLQLVEPGDLGALVPPLDAGVHKGRRGHVGIFGGGEGTTGAPVLAAQGAARARAGLVTALVPGAFYQTVSSLLTAQMVRPQETFNPGWEAFDALVLGPGWKSVPENLLLLEKALSSGLPAVLDAGALDLLKDLLESGKPLSLKNAVLTPHPGEFSRLSGVPAEKIIRDPLDLIKSFSLSHGCWTVLKGATVITASPEGRMWICDGHNPAMGTGGSGDVLAGILGAFLSLGAPRENAVNAAVLAHQEAGRRAWKDHGWFDATALPEALALVLKEVCS